MSATRTKHGPTSNPRLRRLHGGLTILLLAGLAAFLALLAAGTVRVTAPARPADTARPADKGGGRYRIEAVEDAEHAFTETGKVGFLGTRSLEVRVFKYSGGYLECRLEGADAGAQAVDVIPDDWKRLLAGDKALLQGEVDASAKEGYIVLAALNTPLPVDLAVRPYLPHLGGFCAAGHAGPLAVLPYVHLDCWLPREFRLFLSARPPRDKQGAAFRTWTQRYLRLRQPLIPGDRPPESAQVGGGTDLQPGETVTLLERSWGPNRVELKARFLTDDDLARLKPG
jgi:hypothetical protein